MCTLNETSTRPSPRKGARSRPNTGAEISRIVRWAMDERNSNAVTPKQVARYANTCDATARRWRNGSPVSLECAATIAACTYAPVELREALRRVLSPAPADAKAVADVNRDGEVTCADVSEADAALVTATAHLNATVTRCLPNGIDAHEMEAVKAAGMAVGAALFVQQTAVEFVAGDRR